MKTATKVATQILLTGIEGGSCAAFRLSQRVADDEPVVADFGFHDRISVGDVECAVCVRQGGAGNEPARRLAGTPQAQPSAER